MFVVEGGDFGGEGFVGVLGVRGVFVGGVIGEIEAIGMVSGGIGFIRLLFSMILSV